DRFEYLIQNARHVPLSTQIMLNEDELMELIDQIRFNLPDEIKQANWTVSEQQRIVAEAHAEAARTMSRANERAEESASEHEILRRAERHAAQVVKDSQAQGDQIIREAEATALDLSELRPLRSGRRPRSHQSQGIARKCPPHSWGGGLKGRRGSWHLA